MDNSPAQADGNALGPVTGTQFVHDVFDVGLDRLLGDEELVLCNVAIAGTSTVVWPGSSSATRTIPG